MVKPLSPSSPRGLPRAAVPSAPARAERTAAPPRAASTFTPARARTVGTRGASVEPALMKDSDPTKVKYGDVLGGQLYVDGLSYADVTQGESGDCYFLSSVAAVAADDPAALTKALTDNGNGTYTVRFFEKSHGQAKPVFVTVDGQLPLADGQAPDYASGSNPKELWAPIFEKAYAKWKGGYENIGEGGQAGDALYALTGTSSSYVEDLHHANPDATWRRMLAATAAKQPMVAGTDAQNDQPIKYEAQGLVDDHAYTVLSAQEEHGERTVTLRNPWGQTGFKGDLHPHDADDGVFTMKFDDFQKLYGDLYLMKASA